MNYLYLQRTFVSYKVSVYLQCDASITPICGTFRKVALVDNMAKGGKSGLDRAAQRRRDYEPRLIEEGNAVTQLSGLLLAKRGQFRVVEGVVLVNIVQGLGVTDQVYSRCHDPNSKVMFQLSGMQVSRIIWDYI